MGWWDRIFGGVDWRWEGGEVGVGYRAEGRRGVDRIRDGETEMLREESSTKTSFDDLSKSISNEAKPAHRESSLEDCNRILQ